MFEDDGITFKREVERDKKKRKIWKKKKGKLSPAQGGIAHRKPSGRG